MEDVFEIYTCPRTAHLRIRRKDGGALPDSLSGLYTAQREANLDIYKYKETVEQKKPVKDKTAKLEALD